MPLPPLPSSSEYFTDAIATSDNGAKQSDTPCRMDLVPPDAILNVSTVLKQGADKYGENNWKGLPVEQHINHALTHLMGWLAGDRTENHLAHAACRVLFALQLDREARRDGVDQAAISTGLDPS